MRLSAVPLNNYQNTNSYMSANEWTIRSGDPNVLYFQLIDLDSCGGNLRHMTGVGVGNQPVVVTVTFPSIDDTQVITLTAAVDPNDSSIFFITLDGTQFPSAGNVQFSVQEGSGAPRTFSVQNMLDVEIANNSGCC